MSAQQVSEQINKTAIYLFITMCITLFAGTSVSSFFGLTLPSLRLAGDIDYRVSDAFPFPGRAAEQPGFRCHCFCPADHSESVWAGALAAREQDDADIELADLERDAALARVAELESELAVLRQVVTERDRHR